MPTFTPKNPASPLHLEAVVDDLAGAASIAAAILRHISTEPEAAGSPALEEGLDWLAMELSGAAENALAVQRRRAPRWLTLAQSEDVAEAVADAIAAATTRKAGQ